ncbi:MAG: periplasmic heavy metal sensor [Deltaproteobacteria bacterium]|nr:periplasmic heavy metal sensor [Deltaproteobacteria bacterium]
MKRSHINRIMAVLIVTALVGFGTSAFARWGRGSEGCDRGFGSGNCLYGNTLTDEQTKVLADEQKAFIEATKDLRTNINDKRLDLKKELAKEAPDQTMASGLQKEISDLRTQLEQKRLDHIIALKKIDPSAGGFGPGNRRTECDSRGRDCRGGSRNNCGGGNGEGSSSGCSGGERRGDFRSNLGGGSGSCCR